MTDKCNLHCIYCYAAERKEDNGQLLAPENYHQVIDEICDLNKSAVVTFTGGEPLLNKYTIDIARYCKVKGLSTFLLTNGTLIGDNNVDAIKETFDSIRISIDGSNSSIHDKHRGKGSFVKATNAINLLEKNNKIPLIAMTVTRFNIKDIENLSKLYGERLRFQPLYSVGNPRENDYAISGREYYDALNNISNVEPYGQLADRLLSLRNKGCKKCSIGDGEISISPTGDVFPCHMLHDDNFLCGNIKHTSLMDIYFNSPVLKSVRDLSVSARPGCNTCPVRLLCAGGCRARAYYEWGDLDGEDSFCDYEFLAFTQGLLKQYKF